MLCEICSGLMSEPIRMYHTTLECFLASCQVCGTGRSLYPKGYGPNYYSGDYYAYNTHRPGWRRVLKTALWRVPGAGRWFTVIPPKHPGRVLDIGCGYGLFLDVLRSVGWETYGTEIFPKSIEFCLGRHRIYLANEARFSDGFFDWITMDNVLEHITNPQELLQRVRHWLKPNGLLTICVPNFGGIDARFWGTYWYGLMPPHHEFHYTGEGLKRLLSSCGFDSNVRFHIRFEARHSAAARGSGKGIVGLQLRKALHLATAPRISSGYGYFATVNAVPR